jgi:hypothetical protein
MGFLDDAWAKLKVQSAKLKKSPNHQAPEGALGSSEWFEAWGVRLKNCFEL